MRLGTDVGVNLIEARRLRFVIASKAKQSRANVRSSVEIASSLKSADPVEISA
jgi:hypothetical protein